MKNISRRVFIKGMAVAAVATAASTVLTGCKLPAGTTEGTEVVVDPSIKTITLVPDGKKDDEALTVTVSGLSIDPVTGLAILSVDYVNKTGADLAYTTNYTIDAYLDGNTGKAATAYDNNVGEAAKTDLYQYEIPDVSSNQTGKVSGKLYFTLPADTEWSKLYVSYTVKGTKDVTGLMILGK